ncbi:MAG: hypothetical protein WBC33_12705 [Conexibacter sp.]
MSTIAVFVVLGGGAYAAATLPENSVGPKQLQNDAVSSKKVKDHSLKAKDFAKGVRLKGDKGATGASGPQGPTGPAGAAGAAGTARAFGYVEPSCSGTGNPCTLEKTKGIERVYRPATGVYCIVPAAATGIGPNDVVVATVDFLHTTGPEGNAAALSDEETNGGCDTTKELTVLTQRFAAGGNSTAANDVGFSFLIP